MHYGRALVDRVGLRADGPFHIVAANEGLQGDNLDLAMEGLQLARYRANPVVAWMHSWWEPPVGRADNVEVDGVRLVADVSFDMDDPRASALDRKFRAGFLNAFSIGFGFDEKDTEDAGGHTRVNVWELFEISAVTVPLDPSAVVESGRMRDGGLCDVVRSAMLDALSEFYGRRAPTAQEREALEELAELLVL